MIPVASCAERCLCPPRPAIRTSGESEWNCRVLLKSQAPTCTRDSLLNQPPRPGPAAFLIRPFSVASAVSGAWQISAPNRRQQPSAPFLCSNLRGGPPRRLGAGRCDRAVARDLCAVSCLFDAARAGQSYGVHAWRVKGRKGDGVGVGE